MPRDLLDLLWREHPAARPHRRRGPRPQVSAGDVVDRAIRLADSGGLNALTVRTLGEALGLSAMSVYTHVNSREDLLVLMVDLQLARMPLPPFGNARWRTRVRRVAQANLDMLLAHPWILDVSDDRLALGPGTIAKYDHELHAFDGTALDDVTRDASLTFVLDFARAAARSMAPDPRRDAFGEFWAQSVDRLAVFVGSDHPLAQRVGQAAGEALNAAYSPHAAWEFGLQRVLDGLAAEIDPKDTGPTASEGVP